MLPSPLIIFDPFFIMFNFLPETLISIGHKKILPLMKIHSNTFFWKKKFIADSLACLYYVGLAKFPSILMTIILYYNIWLEHIFRINSYAEPIPGIFPKLTFLNNISAHKDTFRAKRDIFHIFRNMEQVQAKMEHNGIFKNSYQKEQVQNKVYQLIRKPKWIMFLIFSDLRILMQKVY